MVRRFGWLPLALSLLGGCAIEEDFETTGVCVPGRVQCRNSEDGGADRCNEQGQWEKDTTLIPGCPAGECSVRDDTNVPICG